MKEEWKIYKITKHHNKQIIYEVSDQGNVKINNRLIDLNTEYKHQGYYRFGRGIPVHRAVAELFVPNPDNKPEVDHINTNTYDNRAVNLRWVTSKENKNNPLTLNHIKTSASSKEHKELLSKIVKNRYKDPEARKVTSEAGKRYYETHEVWNKGLKNCMSENGKQSVSYKMKGAKYMTDGISGDYIKPEYWGEFIDIGWHFKCEKGYDKKIKNKD